MLDTLRHPLSPLRLAQLAAALIAATTLYCLAYTALAGRSESPLDGIVWALVNIAPWLFGFEAGKRFGAPFTAAAATVVVSLVLQALLLGLADPAFELIRRLPAAAAVIALLLLLRSPLAHARAGAISPVDLPLAPSQIAWVAAAGNYVELHGAGRPLLHRAPLSAVEDRLAHHGFVRIHRSTLVNRNRIARIRPRDVLLDTGRSLKLGTRYRTALQG